MWSDVKEDLNRYIGTDRGIISVIAVILFETGFQCTLFYRLTNKIAKVTHAKAILRKPYNYFMRFFFNCEISLDSDIGAGLYLPHPLGVVIGGSSKVGSNCTIYQMVTLGRYNLTIPDYPTIGNNVTLCKGSSVLGEVVVDEGETIKLDRKVYIKE
jgi:serine O-acetyltransferase